MAWYAADLDVTFSIGVSGFTSRKSKACPVFYAQLGFARSKHKEQFNKLASRKEGAYFGRSLSKQALSNVSKFSLSSLFLSNQSYRNKNAKKKMKNRKNSSLPGFGHPVENTFPPPPPPFCVFAIISKSGNKKSGKFQENFIR